MAGVLFDESVTLTKLREFPVVCLPGVTILSDQEVGLFKHYVEEGGKLIITGQSGMYDHYGKPLSRSNLEELTGAKVKRRLDTKDNWVGFDTRCALKYPEILTAIPHESNFLVEGPAVEYEPTTAMPIGSLLQPYRTSRQTEGSEGTFLPMSAEAQGGPAMLINRIGKGIVLTFAGSPDYAAASDFHVAEARKLLSNCIHFLNPKPLVQISAPANVETVITDDPKTKTIRVHFIAYNSLPQSTPAAGRPFILPGLMEDLPMYRSKIYCKMPIKSVKALNRTTHLERNGSTTNAIINDIHEVLLFQY